MDITIEKAKLQEISTIVELLKALYLELGEEAESVIFLNDNLVSEIINSGRTEIYLAKTMNFKIIGIATLTECQSIYAGGKYGLLDEMYVLPEFRSIDIGKKLVDKIIATAKQNRWKRIDVTTPTEKRWERTVKFYKSYGFTFTGQKLKLSIKE